MTTAPDVAALRRAVLIASLLDDVPVLASDAGAVLAADPPSGRDVVVGWDRLAAALAGAPATSLAGRLRLRDWLRARRCLARLLAGASAGDGLGDRFAAVHSRLLPLALPPGHVLHPGAGWAADRVLGGVLDLGPALRLDAAPGSGLPGAVVPLGPGVLACAGLPPGAAWWPPLRERMDELGRLAAARLQRQGTTVITPMGGCDALTLLGSPALRRHLAGGDGVGMQSVGAPMRARVWFDLARIDPAFVVAAAAATDPEHRGVERPLLVTADEVTGVEPRGGTSRWLVLDEPPWAPAGGQRR